MSKPTDSFLTLSDLWHLCATRWRWFIASIFICLLIAARYLLTAPYIYTRYATIMVREESLGHNTNEHNGNEFNQIGFVQQKSNIDNVVRHITSLDILLEVVCRMEQNLTEDEIFKKALDIQSRLSAEIEGLGSSIISLTYIDSSTQEAERVLSLVIQVYNEKWLQDKHMVTQNTSLFIDSRLQLLKRDLNEVDDSISSYKSRYGITDLQHVSDIFLQQQSQADAEILRLTNQKAMAEYIRSLLEDETAQHQLLLVNSGINNSVIESQITLYNSVLLQMQSHLDYTSGQNPLIVNQEKELNSLRKNILANVLNHIRTIDIQLQSLQDYHGGTSMKISSNPDQAKHLVSIEREQKVKESLYMYLLQKKEENEISITYKTAPTQIIDIPHGSGKPTSPNRKKALFVAVIVGLLLPVSVIFLRATMDETVRDRFDILRCGDISFLGEVPLTERRSSIRFLLRRFGMIPPKSSIIVAHGGQGPVNEAFRMIRTKMEAIGNGFNDESKIYMVTAPKESVGKTFVAMNLALALAVENRHVLFIDGDLRKASASRRWATPQKGLSNYLDGSVSDMGSLLFHPKDFPTLDVLPAGPVPPNPTELLRSILFDFYIKMARQQYDLIIIDTPPSDMLADAKIIEKNTDSSLFVIRAGQFERRYLDDLKEPDGKNRKRFVILNGVSIGSRYGHAYGHEYGALKIMENVKKALLKSLKKLKYVLSSSIKLHR